MKRRYFERWNWEYDFGVTEIQTPPESGLPYAVAYCDWEERIYRVEIRTGSRSPQSGFTTAIYDYCWDDTGHLIEKRSLDETGSIVLIVRFTRAAPDQIPTQIAFDPQTGETMSVVRDDYLAVRKTKGGTAF
jgi:hypothetical protein